MMYFFFKLNHFDSFILEDIECELEMADGKVLSQTERVESIG